MKSLIVLSFLFFFSFATIAQDSICAKVQTLMKRSHKVAYRIISKSSYPGGTDMISITEYDTFSNRYSRTTMNLKMGEMILEDISYCGKKYNRKNGEPWKLQETLPELKAKLQELRKLQETLSPELKTKLEKMENKLEKIEKNLKEPPDNQRIRDLHYRDCKQLADEMINDVECEVFTFTTDSYQKNEKTNSFDIMKRKYWRSRQGLLQKSEMAIYSNDNLLLSQDETNYEYDPKILIVEPKIKQK